MNNPYRIQMTNIRKSFGGVHALRGVSIRAQSGEVHAIVGENGAGKSTLMKILSGAYQKDTGEIRLDGHAVHIPDPHTARKLGIGIIYQDFALAPHLTVAENIFMGHLASTLGLVRWRELKQSASALIDQLGFQIDPARLVGNLSVAYQQIVEICKALSEDVKILILDEPTAVLAPHEAQQLFKVIERLSNRGVSVLYISHRLEEIFEVADTVTVVKDGVVTGNLAVAETEMDEVIRLMIGRQLSAMFPSRESKLGDVVLSVEGLNRPPVKDVSFEVRAGEVFGIAGLVGSGRTETVRAIFGADRRDGGQISLLKRPTKIRSPRDAVAEGIAFVPEDRREQGAVLTQSVRVNLTMPRLSDYTAWLGVLRQAKEREFAQDLVKKLGVRAASIESPVSSLSGGNQQKVVLAKWFSEEYKVVILDEPTRGVDVGAKVEIYQLINDLAALGLAVVMISSEMVELIAMCDRVMVMHEGNKQGELKRDQLSEENILRLAVGQRAEAQVE